MTSRAFGSFRAGSRRVRRRRMVTELSVSAEHGVVCVEPVGDAPVPNRRFAVVACGEADAGRGDGPRGGRGGRVGIGVRRLGEFVVSCARL